MKGHPAKATVPDAVSVAMIGVMNDVTAIAVIDPGRMLWWRNKVPHTKTGLNKTDRNETGRDKTARHEFRPVVQIPLRVADNRCPAGGAA